MTRLRSAPRAAALIALLTAALAVSACGRKGPPEAPSPQSSLSAPASAVLLG